MWLLGEERGNSSISSHSWLCHIHAHVHSPVRFCTTTSAMLTSTTPCCCLQVLGLLMHANHLEREYGAGPHTLSVPRMRPADGSDVSALHGAGSSSRGRGSLRVLACLLARLLPPRCCEVLPTRQLQ